MPKDERIRKPASGGAAVKIVNAFRGIPTDEDLRKVYYWESLRRSVQASESYSEAKRKSRLTRLWKAQWYATVQMAERRPKADQIAWQDAFAMIQGHRFLWWASVGAFDNGDAPLGKIFLAGHMGLGTPSPMETRSLSASEVKRLVCVIGRGEALQDRRTLLLASEDDREAFESAVLSVVSMKAD